MANRKNPKADLRKYYTVFMEIGLIATLIVFIAAVKIDFRSAATEFDTMEEQEIVQAEDIVQTEQVEKPPPPPRPPVPVEVPNDEVLEDQILDINADLDLDAPLEMPPPPAQEEEEEEDFFVVVENMPQLQGGLQKLQGCARYPEIARKAGMEGRVIIQFIVNEQGQVEDPRVTRSVGNALDQEALRCVKQAQFTPGKQRGQPVRVQYSLPVVFRLQN